MAESRQPESGSPELEALELAFLGEEFGFISALRSRAAVRAFPSSIVCTGKGNFAERAKRRIEERPRDFEDHY